MHWWHSAFSSKPQSHDDSVIVGNDSRSTLGSGLFSSRQSRRSSLSRKVQQVSKKDNADVWRSLSSRSHNPTFKSTPASPQPLPLPELRVLLQQDPKLAPSAGVPLPSPDTIQNQRAVEEKNREREMTATVNAESSVDVVNGHKSKCAGHHDTQTNAEHSETSSCANSTQNHKPKARSTGRFNLNIANTAPSSPCESPCPSPPRNEYWPNQCMPPQPGVIQTLSAPEMYGNPGQGFSYQHCEKSKSNFDNPPLHSSGMNCLIHTTSSPLPLSQLPTKTSSDSPLMRRDNNIPATVHPLPRPPVAAMSPHTTPVHDFPAVPMTSQCAPISPLKPNLEHPPSGIPAHPSPISPGASKPEVMPIKSQWQKGKLIGRGTFGSVYEASNRETGALCAMKEVEILPDDSKSAECLRQLEQEIKVLSHLKHPNIVQYYGSENISDKFYIYLEYIHPGSINRFVHDHCGAITESVVRNFTRHILCGLAYLHSKKTIHRDIKGANLLVDACGVVKLADFGTAKHLTGQSAKLSLKGSPYWMAPELLQSSMQTDANSDTALAVDIWSLGCTIIEMISGKPPWSEYEGPAALFKVLKESPPIPEKMSEEGKDFLQCCFRRNPADRPSASKLLEHPFVNQLHLPDSSCPPTVKEPKFMDNMHLPRDLRMHKSDQLLEPFYTQIVKGKLNYGLGIDCFPPVRLAPKHSI